MPLSLTTVIEILTALVLLLPSTATASTTSVQILPQVASISETQTIRQYVADEALKRNIDVDRVLKIVNCESQFWPQQSKIVKDGVREESYGIFQINIPHNPEVTVDQAMSVTFSTDWALDRMEQGKWSLWSCDKLVN